MSSDLPDIQQSKPTIFRSISQVGVENVEVPFKLELRGNGFYETDANTAIRTNLDSHTKGISMSRLLLTLQKYLHLPLKQVLVKKILDDLRVNVDSKNSFIKFDFKIPLNRKSPLTDNKFPVYHKCTFEGHMVDDVFTFYQGVTFQYASYCPCSTELCSDLRSKGKSGSPHAQRSYAKVVIESVPGEYIWLEDIITLLEQTIKTLPYPIIKRVDEQEIARIAGEHPIFVEDAIRAISEALDSDSKIKDWCVKCSHEESIHTSEAIAINYKGIVNGFNDRYFV